MIIARGELTADLLSGQVAVVTGGGQGVGYETARSLLWLGAAVVLAEIDAVAGEQAAPAWEPTLTPSGCCSSRRTSAMPPQWKPCTRP